MLTRYPEDFLSVGLVEASAPKGYLRQEAHATNLALEALKKQAAAMGAHAVVIKTYSNERVPDMSLGGDDDLGVIVSTKYKTITAEAIRYL